MRRLFALTLPVLALSLSGCIVQSLHPFYRDQDLVFQPELVGQWTDKAGGDMWEIAKSGDRAYTMTLTESNGDRGVFEGHLLKLGQTLFLDLTVDDAPVKGVADTYRFHQAPIHSISRVDQLAPPIFTPLEFDWMKDLLAKSPNALKHETLGDVNDTFFVLTAETPQLQAFVRTHATDGAAFKKPIELVAKK